MKISIITATYNSEEFLAGCISSVKDQNFKNVEHIIIDGGSSDRTIDIVQSYSHITTVISEPDCGIYDAINKGIRMATGDVIGILNSDDFFADNSVLGDVCSKFDDNPIIDGIYGNVVFVAKDNSSKIVRFYSSKMFKSWMLRFGFQPAHPSFYVRKEVFDKVGVYNTKLKISGDFDLFLRCFLKHNINLKYINRVFVKMRVGGVSSSGLKSVLKLNGEILRSLKENGVRSNIAFVYSKYLIKWFGFINKIK
ncbi:glycosyltransferase family 2 protein [Pedobacter duraquae]|uniref:Glycosyl transferase family 2 n=1 Tax=Pedobacter duraquae TaxID=425511 RepID=A0A4R6IJ02_9SPHI|nr:glycosyltransferase family 2 protein [Pedobacter duraquae]TDO21979.1 glycosyl transferase family 2 [Pedobacter duraquae]